MNIISDLYVREDGLARMDFSLAETSRNMGLFKHAISVGQEDAIVRVKKYQEEVNHRVY